MHVQVQLDIAFLHMSRIGTSLGGLMKLIRARIRTLLVLAAEGMVIASVVERERARRPDLFS